MVGLCHFYGRQCSTRKIHRRRDSSQARKARNGKRCSCGFSLNRSLDIDRSRENDHACLLGDNNSSPRRRPRNGLVQL